MSWRWRKDRGALGAYLRSAAAGTPDHALLATVSESGARRVFDAWLDDQERSLLKDAAQPVVGRAESAELWTRAVGELAEKHPAAFLDCVLDTGERPPDTTAAMLTVLSRLPH